MTQIKIAIFGAGAVGCFVGGAWLDAGLDVTFIGREHIGNEIKEHGLNLTDNKGYEAHIPAEKVNYSSDSSVLREADLIVLCVKNTGSEEAAKEIAAHSDDSVPVLCLQNGVSNVARIKEWLPGREILAGMTPYNVAYLGKASWHKGSPGYVTVQKTRLTEKLVEGLGDHMIQVALADDMEAVVWGKLLLNLNNAVNGLSGRSLLEELLQRGYRKVLAASIKETLRALKAKGIKPAKVGIIAPAIMPSFFEAPDMIYHAMIKGKIDPKATSSMADDFNAGRATEIDFLNGEVVRLGEEVGVATPVNNKIIELVRAAEKGGRRDWSPEELQKEVLGK